MKDPKLPVRAGLLRPQTLKSPSYVDTLQAALAQRTAFAASEPNSENLWASVRRTVTDYLLIEWRKGTLLGHKPEEAFFVRCDRSTMTQNDLDEGRLICVVGVAPVKPAEFVVFYINQSTAGRKT